MKIKLHLIPEEGMRIEGDEPAGIMDVRDEVYRFEKPIHYALEAVRVGNLGLSVRGSLSTTVRACCVRTLEWFDLPLEIEEFQYHSPEIGGDEVDLTREIREDILLALPPNPISPHAPAPEGEKHAPSEGADKVWGKLDQLKITPKKSL